jgi:Holliday junction DNA helicase RuvB
MLDEFDDLDFLTDILKEEVVDVFQPPSLAEFIGQEDIKKLISIAISAAKTENRALPNIMLTGAFGLGKTALAQLIVKEFGAKINLVDGASVNKNLPSGLTIIDEIHNLTPETCDSLNIKIDQNKVHIIGCTTDPGSLPGAFRSRFRTFQLKNYTQPELVQIASNICDRKLKLWEAGTLELLAQRSRFNARAIIQLLNNIFDMMTVSNAMIMSKDIVLETFNLLGVDQNGYLERDKDYVRVLPDRPVGLKWLSSVLGIDPTTIEEEIEPYLLQTGVIDRTPRGRLKIRDI